MKFLVRWFLDNPVAANLLAVFFLLAGLLSSMSMRIEGFPRLPADTVSITTIYPHASPEQVETELSRRIEDSLSSIDGIKKINTISGTGYSQLNIVRKQSYDISELKTQIKEKLDAISDFPPLAEKPVIESNDFDFPAMYIVVSAVPDQQELQSLARQLKNRLLESPEISRIKIIGQKPAEINIGVNQSKLADLNLSMADVAAAVRNASVTEGLGHLDSKAGRLYIKTDRRYESASALADIVIRNSVGMEPTRLSDIAEIKEEYRDDHVYVRMNGEDAMVLELLIAKKENLLEIAEVAKQTITQFSAKTDAEVTVFGDSSSYIKDRLSLLQDNAIQGLIIVFVLLALFLNLKVAFWVALGIPVSLGGAAWFMGLEALDYSINDITTFGVIVSLGILVDDAVVVGESVHEHRHHSSDARKSVVVALEKVAVATTFGALTTIAAFSPMLMLDSALGKILGTFSAVVILAVLFSLLESKLILPVHLLGGVNNESYGFMGGFAKLWQPVQAASQRGLLKFRDSVYLPVLNLALKFRRTVFSLFTAAILLCASLIYEEYIAVVLFPDIPGDMILVDIDFDAQFPAHKSLEAIADISIAGTEVAQRLELERELPKTPIKNIFYVMLGPSKAQIYAELSAINDRGDLSQAQLISAWRSKIGKPEGITSIRLNASDTIAGGFELILRADSEEHLHEAANRVKHFLAQQAGVTNIKLSGQGASQLVHIDSAQKLLDIGLSHRQLSEDVKTHFAGTEVFRFYRGVEEVKVWVKASSNERDSIYDLLNKNIKNSEGYDYRLADISSQKQAYQADELERMNRSRVFRVQATLAKDQVAPEQLYSKLSAFIDDKVKIDIPGVSYSSGGELEEGDEIKGKLKKAFFIAIFLIYALIAVPLKSYTKPLIILSVIPLGAVGAIIGHGLLGLPISLMSLFGLMALCGIIVNDSLVLVVRYNENLSQGMPVLEAVQRACKDRFQAIFLTTATTVLGLLPLMLETSEQAQYLIPAAVSLAFGELFGTLLTLILIPLILVEKHELSKKIFA